MKHEFIKDTIITEFRGNFPLNIPVRPGVDLDKLTEGDEHPFFLTLEISSEGRVSDNGLIHDDEFAKSVTEQIMSNATEGIMGHIKEPDRDTTYPVSDIHWIGAVRESGKTWAKGYIPKTAVAQREHYRILLATHGKAATSVYGQAVREFTDGKSWKAKNFKLEQLDLAPYSRAALKPESGFVITAETTNRTEGDMTMTDKVQVIREMTPEDAPLIPKAIREAIQAEVPTPQEVAMVAELRTALGVDEKADLKAVIAEMQKQQVEQRETAIKTRITELVDDGIKVETLRPLVTEIMTSRKPQSLEDVQAIYQQVVEMDSVKGVLENYVQNTMGPRQTTPMRLQNGKAVDKWFPVAAGGERNG